MWSAACIARCRTARWCRSSRPTSPSIPATRADRCSTPRDRSSASTRRSTAVREATWDCRSRFRRTSRRKVADQLKTHGKVAHGRLGIGIQGLDQSLAQSFGLPDSNGALVGQVEKDSPAAKAGFKSGDVIRKIDGVAVIDSTDVTSRIGNTAPGTALDVEVWRAGKAIELSAKVGTLDDGKVAKVSDEAEPKGKLGIAVRPRNADEQKAGAKAGLVVEQAGGAAAKAGVQAGDVILGVGSSAVNSVDELRSRGRQVRQDRRAPDRAPGPPDLRAGQAVLIRAFSSARPVAPVSWRPGGRLFAAHWRDQAAAATFNASTRISSVRRAFSAENSGVVFTV